ncbi:class I SAM-dependent methyltransferase [Nocardia arizonensis]|uniref:class I SAM-dependent methyltransferase n=1 Tax=Nocardia arizonensis TaxID=1141647 RepID=UPI0006D26268|nr:methyltransferase domain-containing protein [Nocardia arizonensis]
MSGIRDRFLSTLAGQLGRPHGLLGKGVASVLNRSNRSAITAAVDCAAAGPGGRVADIGFGGGAGLRQLLDVVGEHGVVHGVELSVDMLTRAESVYAKDIAAGRLHLAEGSLTALPLEENSLDAAITVNTIYFVADLDAVCAELARVVRPGGRAVIGIADPEAAAKLPFTAHGFLLRPVPEVIAAFERAGCEVEHRHFAHRPIPHHMLIGRPR